MDMPLSDISMNKEKPTGICWGSHPGAQGCSFSGSSKITLGLQAGLLCCFCCQMFRWRFFSRDSMGSTLPRASRLSFPSPQPLLPAWGNPEFFLCPIISLCSCTVSARAVQEWCLGVSELRRVISSRENTEEIKGESGQGESMCTGC